MSIAPNITLEDIDKVIARSEGHRRQREEAFLTSIRQQFIQKGSLSYGQEQWFQSIAETYSDEAMNEEEQWRLAWDDERRTTAVRIAHYYQANPPYFSNYVDMIFLDPSRFILTKKQWNKFCENKYAKRIRGIYDVPEKFKQGDLVQIRVNNRLDIANYNAPSRAFYKKNADKAAFVLKVNALPITRAAKGARVHQFLVAGPTKPIMAHESDLKKARRKKNV
ncbi:hypothetical protein CMO96_04300, partial [Candidatus Woesebacteria bacterium]|nr:hypothetical protein [Candidatus Woesebacteria bacterium]